MSRVVRLLLPLLLLTACGTRTPLNLDPDGPPITDASVRDAGTRDASIRDTGFPDTGLPDAAVGCRSDRECDDGVFCNGVERCIRATCFAEEPPCGPSDFCFQTFCDEETRSCFEEIRDEDGDGFASFECGGEDCDDFDVQVHPAANERCRNGRDDNCNGLVDCMDPQCVGGRACPCEMTERCGANVDADCDGAVGCADPDCEDQPVCNGMCESLELGSMLGNRVASGSTRNNPDRWQPSCAGRSPGGDHIYRWVAPLTGEVSFNSFGSSYDTALALLVTCQGPEIDCNDDARGVQSEIVFFVEEGQELFIVVDGWGGNEGDYVLSIEPR